MLLEWRNANKLSKAEAAKLLNLSYPTYLKIETSGEMSTSILTKVLDLNKHTLLIIPKSYIHNF